MKLNRYILLIFLFVSGAVLAHGDKEEKEDSKMVNVETDVGEAVAKLHSALQSGDESTIKSIMHEKVLIFEGAGAERLGAGAGQPMCSRTPERGEARRARRRLHLFQAPMQCLTSASRGEQ